MERKIQARLGQPNKAFRQSLLEFTEKHQLTSEKTAREFVEARVSLVI